MRCPFEIVISEMQKAASMASALVLFFPPTVLIFACIRAKLTKLECCAVLIFYLCAAVLIYYCACRKLNSQHSCLPVLLFTAVLIFGLFTQN